MSLGEGFIDVLSHDNGALSLACFVDLDSGVVCLVCKGPELVRLLGVYDANEELFVDMVDFSRLIGKH